MRVEMRGAHKYLIADDGAEFPVQRFADAKRAEQDRAVFLLASGPSLRDFPIEQYKSHAFMAMNGSILFCEAHQITPLFYLCDDFGFFSNRKELFLKGCTLASNLATNLHILRGVHAADPTILARTRIFLMERVNRQFGVPRQPDRRFAWRIKADKDLFNTFSLFSPRKSKIGFSGNLDKGYFSARTIPYAALQIAYTLGFTKVFLVGMDLQAGAGRFYESASNGLPSVLDEHYHDYILPSFEVVRNKVVTQRFQVFNLSQQSRLPHAVIPKITLNQLDALL